MTAPDPATMCTDIHRWLTLLADRLDAATGLHATRPTAPRSTHPHPGALPHGLTAALDQLDDGVNPARAGMIPARPPCCWRRRGKPRASGDDPAA